MIQKICDVLLGLFLTCLAILALLLFVPQIFGYQTLGVLSGSMEPEIAVGSIIYTKKTSSESYEKGDIITYKIGEGTLVTHRIEEVDIENMHYITKGDANENVDGAPVYYSSVIGKLEYCIPLLGYFSIYAKTPLGIAGIAAVLFIVLLLNFLPDILKKDDQKVNYNPHSK